MNQPTNGLLRTLQYPVWIAGIRNPGATNREIPAWDEGPGPGVLLLRTLQDVASFRQRCRQDSAASGDPHEPDPLQLDSLRELYDFMSGDAKAQGIRMVYFWEKGGARDGELTR
jgi:hypothetical protein